MLDISDGTFTTPAANTPVRIKRMKPRTVNVTFYKVGDLLNQGGTAINADRVAEQAVLEAFLAHVYKPQVNVSVKVSIMPEQAETADVVRTIGHEMPGGGHPGIKDGSSQGIAPLPGTRHSEMLMRDGNNNPDSDACLLVKAEWDKIEK
jgi:hypothetical protein